MDKIFDLIKLEEKRQRETLMLIASENYTSKAVREAVGSVLGNKYAEGYPGKRYYQGNKIVDEIELLAIERAKKLFGVEYVNVQPYSGSPANSAVFMALVEPGEKVMGLALSGGGHLTHGHPKITFSGRYYSSVQYNVNADGWIDYDEVERLASLEKPKLIVCGTTAYPRIIDFARFSQIAKNVGAYLLADISHIAGLVAGGAHPTPVGFADVITTTTHKTLRGPRGAMIMTNNEELAKKIDRAVFPGMQGGPHENSIAAMAIAFSEALNPNNQILNNNQIICSNIQKYAGQVVRNAKVLSEELINLGFNLTTGGTDNHLMVVDLRNLNISGKEAAVRLEEAGIVLNYNSIPHDPNPPGNPSGIRLGTPAVTTRGMTENEMRLIAHFMSEILNPKFQDPNKLQGPNSKIQDATGEETNIEDRESKKIREIREQVIKLCETFPI